MVRRRRKPSIRRQLVAEFGISVVGLVLLALLWGAWKVGALETLSRAIMAPLAAEYVGKANPH